MHTLVHLHCRESLQLGFADRGPCLLQGRGQMLESDADGVTRGGLVTSWALVVTSSRGRKDLEREKTRLCGMDSVWWWVMMRKCKQDVSERTWMDINRNKAGPLGPLRIRPDETREEKKKS